MSAGDHSHPTISDSTSLSFDRVCLLAVGAVGLLLNVLTLALLAWQRRTRRLSHTFIAHSCLLNIVQCLYCLKFSGMFDAERMSANACNRLGSTFIVFMTCSVFNLIAIGCCEVYHFDYNPRQRDRPPPRSSVWCVAFGIVLVYAASAVLHLGPTLIGASFETDKTLGCLLAYGQSKNYVSFAMWVLIVSIALSAATHYIVVFLKVINKQVQVQLMQLTEMAEELSIESDSFERKLEQLSSVKVNRQRVIAAMCGLQFVSWYPLFILILLDPMYRVSVTVYQALTIFAMSKCITEPLMLVTLDKVVGRCLLKLLPCYEESDLSCESDIGVRVLVAKLAETADMNAARGGALEAPATLPDSSWPSVAASVPAFSHGHRPSMTRL